MKIGIYIGTSKRDIVQYRYLVNSIKAYNIDNIPVYTCVNDDDLEIFKTEFDGYGITFLKDNDVYPNKIENVWYKQQLIKMNFWRTNLLDIMVQIDSDSFFIKNFYKSDFMVNENIPYTVIHENKELKEFFSKYNLFNSQNEDNGDFRINQGFSDNSLKIRDILETNHITAEYDYGHPPCIWSNKIWEKLYVDYIEPNQLTYEQLLEYANSEQQWYGEMLLATNLFPIYPKENLFKTFHYKENYIDFIKENNKLENIKYNYHGICLQSNWSANTQDFKNIYNEFFDINKNPKMYNGQFGEDKWIIDNIKLPKNGTFVDVGADQSIYGSNTYYFEKYLGWNGICVDADERTINKLKEKRKKVLYTAVSDVDGEITFNQHDLAGISSISKQGNTLVSCKKLNTILEEENITEITLLDIDVEGHEIQVCNGLDWEKYKPQIVIIEFISPTGGDIRNQLLEFFNNLKTYKLVHTTQANFIFIYEAI
jgi:FkbM family methyltransferase